MLVDTQFKPAAGFNIFQGCVWDGDAGLSVPVFRIYYDEGLYSESEVKGVRGYHLPGDRR